MCYSELRAVVDPVTEHVCSSLLLQLLLSACNFSVQTKNCLLTEIIYV